MAYSARILADSIAPNGYRLTTWELCYWRAVHDELLTHREFSRNTASTRAIPTDKMIDSILNDPALPIVWGSNKPGMQPGAEIHPQQIELAKMLILEHRDCAIALARALQKLGLHKQIVGRYLQPFSFTTVIVSATSFSNFFGLRCDSMAQAEIRYIAHLMRAAYRESVPKAVEKGYWHLPMIEPEERNIYSQEQLRKMCVARCARVSYARHMDRRTVEEECKLHDDLVAAGHMSCFEHQAQAMGPVPYSAAEIDHALSACDEGECEWCKDPDKPSMEMEEAEMVNELGFDKLNNMLLCSGNFKGWEQYRKMIQTEYIGEYALFQLDRSGRLS